jgi:hypothetical protein
MTKIGTCTAAIAAANSPVLRRSSRRFALSGSSWLPKKVIEETSSPAPRARSTAAARQFEAGQWPVAPDGFERHAEIMVGDLGRCPP